MDQQMDSGAVASGQNLENCGRRRVENNKNCY